MLSIIRWSIKKSFSYHMKESWRSEATKLSFSSPFLFHSYSLWRIFSYFVIACPCSRSTTKTQNVKKALLLAENEKKWSQGSLNEWMINYPWFEIQSKAEYCSDFGVGQPSNSQKDELSASNFDRVMWNIVDSEPGERCITPCFIHHSGRFGWWTYWNYCQRGWNFYFQRNPKRRTKMINTSTTSPLWWKNGWIKTQKNINWPKFPFSFIFTFSSVCKQLV